MDLSEYGPFGTTIAVVFALAAAFSVLLVKAVGRLKQWTWLTHDTPSFVVQAPAQALAVALIAATFLTIDRQNYPIFLTSAVLAGVLMLVLVLRFERERKLHVWQIPIVRENGSQACDKGSQPRFRTVVIGCEAQMRSTAREKLNKARKQNATLTPGQFMSGYGGSVNQPEALWPSEVLVSISTRLTMLLIGIVLAGVMALYLAAAAVEVNTRSPRTAEEEGARRGPADREGLVAWRRGS